MTKSIQLLDQLIEHQEKIDKENNAKAQRFQDQIGESFMLFYLKQLKDLIKKESESLSLAPVCAPH